MTRSSWKGPYVNHLLLKDSNNIKIYSKNSMIVPRFINKKFNIYNGKKFITILVSEDMVGYKFGEFLSTRKKCIHKKKRMANALNLRINFKKTIQFSLVSKL